MTIRQLADELHTTPVTIYRRLTRRGLDVSALRDGETGELSQHGASVIASLFDGDTQRKKAVSDTQRDTQQDTQQDQAGNQAGNPAASPPVEVLKAKLEAAEERCRMLEDERNNLRTMLEAATRALEREQADRQQERLLLTSHDSRGFSGLLARFKARRSKGE